MKPWTDTSLNRNPEPEMSAIGVQISFDAAFVPGILGTLILFRIFSHIPRFYLNPILFMALAFKLARCKLLS
jgi:hypothetical protein